MTETATMLQPAEAAASASLWARVDELLSRAPRASDLRAHRVQLLELDRRRRRGLDVDPELLFEERRAAVNAMAVPALLARARAAYDGAIVVIKGPEVAAHYPHPLLRPFADLDLLVGDSRAAQRALIAAGFQELGDPAVYTGIHHLRPLSFPGLTLTIELHHEPKWLPALQPAPVEDLLAAAVPGRLAPGVLALPRAHHAIVLALHSWAHVPLDRLSHLIDVAAVAEGVPRHEIDALAESWGVGRVWRSTAAATDGLFAAARRPLCLRTWARNVAVARERTVLESHLERWLSELWALSPPRALRATGRRIGRELRRSPDESWRAKGVRTRTAIRNASKRLSEHERALEEIAGQRQSKEAE